jgi:hypothetical protein
MSYTIDANEYLQMNGEDLPYKTDWDFTITEFNVECNTCKEPTTNQKYRFNEYQNSVDIIGVGVCFKCKQIVTSRPFRIYRDGRAIFKDDNDQWVEGKFKKDNIFVYLFRILMDKFFGGKNERSK